MQTYWDLTEAERAALSEQDVERYVDAELMTKGVLRTRPLELVDEPQMPAPDTTLYVVDPSWYASTLGFLSAEAATEAQKQSLRLGTEYINGKSVDVASPFGSSDIKQVRVYSPTALASARPLMERATAASVENERRRQAHAKAREAERSALSGLWEDWHRCRAKSTLMHQVVDVFREYTKLAGGDVLAGKFLLKVFGAAEIREAAEWCAVQIPLDVPEPKQTAVAAIPSDDAIPF